MLTYIAPFFFEERPKEADFGGASLSDSWFNTTAYGSISFDDLMASLSGDIISSESDNLLDADGSFAEGGATPVPFTSPESPASSSSSDSGSDRRQSNPIPRHKRPSHKRAELKRRDKIKTRLEDLKIQVPSLADKGKMSESIILTKAAEYCRHLKADRERYTTEAGSLRREIESLSREIHSFQERLPAAGLKVEEPDRISLDQMYNDYVASRVKTNWKFWIFSFLVRPLFDSFKTLVSTNDSKSFLATLGDWTINRASLSNLRKIMLESVLRISKETRIMTAPEELPMEALASLSQQSTPASSPS
ncbi:hypothetical protein C0Q70_10598 [Pomacea canaliculata]|uniref:BHLH domain-containing protein n=1 Tax=Pomacea canaliculata TaxID=400727 RepID=A0A2T7P3N5_POMCA|nr:hypothetical protein C0Q70_10598 [Pomacea canaliculata]